MAALSVAGIDNVLIEINNQEMPIMDGSALPFIEALQNAGTVEQDAERRSLKVLKPVNFVDDKGNAVVLRPADEFSVHFTIEFPSKVVGHQEFNEKSRRSVLPKNCALPHVLRKISGRLSEIRRSYQRRQP